MGWEDWVKGTLAVVASATIGFLANEFLNGPIDEDDDDDDGGSEFDDVPSFVPPTWERAR
jgi:hypothetical protein